MQGIILDIWGRVVKSKWGIHKKGHLYTMTSTTTPTPFTVTAWGQGNVSHSGKYIYPYDSNDSTRLFYSAAKQEYEGTNAEARINLLFNSNKKIFIKKVRIKCQYTGGGGLGPVFYTGYIDENGNNQGITSNQETFDGIKEFETPIRAIGMCALWGSYAVDASSCSGYVYSIDVIDWYEK